jgi:hypothetical protein
MTHCGVHPPVDSSGFCGALRFVASVQVAPGARLREAKCLMEVVREVMERQSLGRCDETGSIICPASNGVYDAYAQQRRR